MTLICRQTSIKDAGKMTKIWGKCRISDFAARIPHFIARDKYQHKSSKCHTTFNDLRISNNIHHVCVSHTCIRDLRAQSTPARCILLKLSSLELKFDKNAKCVRFFLNIHYSLPPCYPTQAELENVPVFKRWRSPPVFSVPF